jgi:hypothetical protein
MFFLLLVAVPTASYVLLHRSLVQQYKALVDAEDQNTREVRDIRMWLWFQLRRRARGAGEEGLGSRF